MEHKSRPIDALTARGHINISSAKCYCIHLILLCSVRGFVKAIVDPGVGRDGGQYALQVCLVDTISGEGALAPVHKQSPMAADAAGQL